MGRKVWLGVTFVERCCVGWRKVVRIEEEEGGMGCA